MFEGRAGQGEYWWFTLANLVVFVVLAVLSSISAIFSILYLIFALAIIVPGLAVAVRRLHDTDKSGWMLLISLIPIVGFIIVLVFLAMAGDSGENRYGPPAASIS